MDVALTDKIAAALSGFSSATRLYALRFRVDDNQDKADDLLVEAFCAHDAVQETGSRDVIVLSTNPGIDANTLLGQTAQLLVSLPTAPALFLLGTSGLSPLSAVTGV